MDKDRENFDQVEIKTEIIEGNDFVIEINQEVIQEPIYNNLNLRSSNRKKVINKEKLHLKQKYRPASKKFKCDECEKAFSKRRDLISHKKSSHGDFECKTCGIKFQKKGFFDNHKCAICEICNKNCFKESLLIQHMKSHNVENRRKFECDFCGRFIVTRKGILLHVIESHSGFEKASECDLCGKTFGLKSSLRRHMSHHRKTNCNVCEKLIATKSIKDHIKQHHGESNFKCEKCPKMFKTNHALRHHWLIHDKKFACNICNRKFETRRRLTDHQVIHDNPDAFQCTICRISYTRLDKLKLHMKVKHGDKKDLKYQCEKCEHATHDKRRIEKHRKMHEKYEEKLRSRSDWFKCEKCRALLASKAKLEKHIRDVHGPPAECDLCGIKFKFYKSSLIQHFKKHQAKSSQKSRRV